MIFSTKVSTYRVSKILKSCRTWTLKRFPFLISECQISVTPNQEFYRTTKPKKKKFAFYVSIYAAFSSISPFRFGQRFVSHWFCRTTKPDRTSGSTKITEPNVPSNTTSDHLWMYWIWGEDPDFSSWNSKLKNFILYISNSTFLRSGSRKRPKVDDLSSFPTVQCLENYQKISHLKFCFILIILDRPPLSIKCIICKVLESDQLNW